MRYTSIPTTIGQLHIIFDENAVNQLLFADEPIPQQAIFDDKHHIGQKAAQELQEYFAGKRQAFSFPWHFASGTAWQQKVWQYLARIPFGRTQSYGEVAKNLGKPKHARAVGAAVGKNPLPIVLPCHRVIGHNGSLTGFAGGLDRKQTLLTLENCC